jgi:hypothetical protein
VSSRTARGRRARAGSGDLADRPRPRHPKSCFVSQNPAGLDEGGQDVGNGGGATPFVTGEQAEVVTEFPETLGRATTGRGERRSRARSLRDGSKHVAVQVDTEVVEDADLPRTERLDVP